MVNHSSWSLSNVWEYIAGGEADGDLGREAHARSTGSVQGDLGGALCAALATPGGMSKAFRCLQDLLAAGLDPLEYLDTQEFERLSSFGARYLEFIEMVRPDFSVRGWITRCNAEGDVVFAHRSGGGSDLQVLFMQDFQGFDAVQAAVGFSEADLHAHHVEGLLESTPLVESVDAGLWVQLRETTDEIVQVEMVNMLDEPLGAIVHMYYSWSEPAALFRCLVLPEPKKPRHSLNYKQSVSFSPLPEGHVRAHFAFVMDIDPRMQLALQRLPADAASSLLQQAFFSSWPTTFQAFLEGHRATIARRERTSVHSAFYALCRARLQDTATRVAPAAGGGPAAADGGEEDDAAFFDAEEGEGPPPGGCAAVEAGTPPCTAAEAAAAPAAAGSDQAALWRRFMGGDAAPEVRSALPRRPSSVGADLNEYQQRHRQDYEALRALEPLDGWDFRMAHDGVDIYTKDMKDMPCKCFKGYIRVRTFGGGSRSLTEALKAHNNRIEWDDMCITSRVVEEYPPYYAIAHFRFASGTPFISAREMLSICHLYFEDDGSVFLTAKSTDVESIPEDPNCVRCTLHHGGYIIRPTGDNDVFQVVYAGCVDGGGWVPTWVQDLVAWRQPLALGKFKTYFEEGAREGGTRFEAIRGMRSLG